ncbi:MAG: Rab family GTPase [Candidatus Hodarchaeales archaeon]|jgi:small GTP-binding protein
MALLVKICLIGDGGVGKTSLKDRYLKRSFQSDYIPTLGSDVVSKKVVIKTDSGSKEIRFQIWDLAGQPAFNQVRIIYFKYAVGAFVIFDITRPETLDNLKSWMRELNMHSGPQNISVIVLGNKIDLKNESLNTIDSEKAIDFLKRQLTAKFDRIDNNISYYETSAKTGQNVDKAFQELGLRIYKKINAES